MKENLDNYGLYDSNRQKVESYFDDHPTPWDIEEIQILESKMYKIVIYAAENFKDDYMIKIICNNARLNLTLSKRLKFLCNVLGLERISIGRKLFLLRRSFFES